MIDNDVSVELADRFVGAVRDRLDSYELRDDSVVRHALLREIELSIKTTSQSLLTQKPVSPTARPNVIALIGPTGVGKTTTVAKLAASAKLRHGKRVALITSDTYRIAAVEQLKTYASIIGLEIKIANSPDEMRSVISGLSDVDLIVIDTAGRSQNNHARLDELGQLIAAAEPDETHLVLSSTVGENVLRKTAERFIDLGPDRCILTKIDEAVTTGMIAGMSERIGGLPLSFVTVGQEVPDDILPAKPERLARAVLDGPSAVVPQN
jgi:flagellar biosynthesis protein FlhF